MRQHIGSKTAILFFFLWLVNEKIQEVVKLSRGGKSFASMKKIVKQGSSSIYLKYVLSLYI